MMEEETEMVSDDVANSPFLMNSRKNYSQQEKNTWHKLSVNWAGSNSVEVVMMQGNRILCDKPIRGSKYDAKGADMLQ